MKRNGAYDMSKSCEPIAIEMLDLIEETQRVHNNWREAEDSSDVPPGRLMEKIDEILALHDEAVSIPFLGTALNGAIKRLAVAKVREDERDTPIPRGDFWDAVEGVFLQRDRLFARMHTPVAVESVKQLVEIGATDDQIARTYGLVDEYGYPQVHMIAQEKKNPGSVISADWQHPREIERLQLLEAYELGRKNYVSAESSGRTTKEREPCVETWEELAALGVSAKQAAAMKCVTEAVAAKELAKSRPLDQPTAAVKSAKGKKGGGKRKAEETPAPTLADDSDDAYDSLDSDDDGDDLDDTDVLDQQEDDAPPPAPVAPQRTIREVVQEARKLGIAVVAGTPKSDIERMIAQAKLMKEEEQEATI